MTPFANAKHFECAFDCVYELLYSTGTAERVWLRFYESSREESKAVPLATLWLAPWPAVSKAGDTPFEDRTLLYGGMS
jgi:hypothetical protein